jgi:hypothetical protein
VSVIALFALLAAVCSTLSLALIRNASAKTAREVDQSYEVAEAGVARSLYEMQLGVDYSGGGIGNSGGTVGGGDFVSTVAPAFAGPGEYTISSIGTVNGIRRGVSAIVRRAGNGMGFFGESSVTQSSGMIDSYDSSLGSYASQVVPGGHAGTSGNLQSNGNIALSGSATIWGNATPGVGALVTGAVGGVHGSTAPATTPTLVAPFVYAPPILPMGSLAASKTLTSGTYRYTQVTIGGGQTLTFSGDVKLYVDGKFTITGSGVGKMLPGAKVTIYQGANDITFSGNGVINMDQQPTNLRVYSASTTKVTVSGSAAFYGVLSAPLAQIINSGSADFYGAEQGKSLVLFGSGKMHYDAALGSGGVGFQVILKQTFRP